MVGIPNTKGFIVDGFPREMEQGKEFENEVSTFVSYVDERAPAKSYSIDLNYWPLRRHFLSFVLSIT